MSKQDDDLAELQKFFDQEISKIETSQPKKGEDKKSLTETAKRELNIPIEDRYLYDLLGAYAGKKTAGMLDSGVRKMSEISAPSGGMPAPVAGGPAGPVGGPASSGAKWLQNWGGISKEGFSGGVPEGAAQYNKMKPQGQIMQGLAKKGLITPQPVQPGVFTGGQLSISGQPSAAPPAPPSPAPGALSKATGVLKQGANAILNTPGVSGALGGLSAAESGQEFMKRQSQGDVPGQFMAGMGVLGGGMAMVPNPLVKAAGAALSTASPLSLYLYDKLGNKGQQYPHLTPQQIERIAAQESEERGSAPSAAFGIYPKPMRLPPLKPRIPELGTNLPPVEFYR